jgi:hypothetical protein
MIIFFRSTIAQVDGGLPTNNITGFFSLRQLSGYSGSCIRVIRDSDLTTQDIGFSGGVVDTAAITSFCTGTTGRINRWYNQVDGNFASQATQANQPIIYTAGAVVTVNTKPALTFDLNDRLDLNTPVAFKSVFVVLKVDTISTINYWADQIPSAPLFASGTFGGINGCGLLQTSVRITNSTENTNQNQHTLIKDTNYLAVDTNSSDFVSNTHNVGTNTFGFIGYSSSSLGLRGKMQEVVVYSDNRTSDKSTIETEIQTYYGI